MHDLFIDVALCFFSCTYPGGGTRAERRNGLRRRRAWNVWGVAAAYVYLTRLKYRGTQR